MEIQTEVWLDLELKREREGRERTGIEKIMAYEMADRYFIECVKNPRYNDHKISEVKKLINAIFKLQTTETQNEKSKKN